MTNSEDTNTANFQQQVLEQLDNLKQEFDNLNQKVDQRVNQLSDDVEKLSDDVEKFNEKFSNYQQAIQWVVQLSFTLIASATVTVIITAVFKR